MIKAICGIAACVALGFSVLTAVAAPADNPGGATPAITTGSTKPHLGSGPADEKSLPSPAPSATTKRTTGATDQDKTVKAMNRSEKAKVEAGGK
jgi:hypothetical protein